MATGINKNEQLSKDAKLAKQNEAHPLPDCSSGISLQYDNKMPANKILKNCDNNFTLLSKDGNASSADNIITNSLVLSDNYIGLQKLLSSHKGKVTLIYLDPPYGTGMDFQSRDLQHAYADLMGTASWVEMMRRRLILMKELMTDDGSIYVHIGHQMLFHLKIIMDEVFGADNFRNLITRKKCSSKNSTTKQYPNLNDYILFYSKSNKCKFNKPGIPASKAWIAREYNKVDNKGQYKLVPIHAPGTRNGATGTEWKGMLPPPGKHWQLLPSKLDALDAAGEIHWSKNGNPRRKVYLPDNKKVPITDYWDLYRDAHHQSNLITGYPTEKNLDMLKMIVETSTDEGDIVLDPFCGSGTTLQAARDMHRKWIGIDQSFTAIKTSLNRMRFGLTAMGDFVNSKKETVEQTPDLLTPTDCGSFIIEANVYLEHQEELIEMGKMAKS